MVTTRSATHVENLTARKKAIVVTQLPYMVGPERVLERISEGVKNHKLDGISGAIDLTDRHNGTRIVIELKTGFDPAAVLAQLFKHTPLQENFAINNVALVNGRPHTLGLRSLLDVWIEHRRGVIRRRSEFRRQKALDRLHLVEGLLLALVDIDEVIRVILPGRRWGGGQNGLMSRFSLDDIQAQYILDLRLRRLTKMSRIELESERDELQSSITELERILGSAALLDGVVIDEMDKAVATYGTPRRTVLLDEGDDGRLVPVVAHGDDMPSDAALDAARHAENVLDAADAVAAAREAGETAEALRIEDEPCVIALSASGLIARMSIDALTIWAKRGAHTEKREPDDVIVSLMPARTRADYALVTSAGRMVLAHVVELPNLEVTGHLSLTGGIEATELLTSTESTDPVPGERVIATLALRDTVGQDDTAAQLPPVGLGTRNGIVKRWNRESPTTMDSWSIIDLKDGDERCLWRPMRMTTTASCSFPPIPRCSRMRPGMYVPRAALRQAWPAYISPMDVRCSPAPWLRTPMSNGMMPSTMTQAICSLPPVEPWCSLSPAMWMRCRAPRTVRRRSRHWSSTPPREERPVVCARSASSRGRTR